MTAQDILKAIVKKIPQSELASWLTDDEVEALFAIGRSPEARPDARLQEIREHVNTMHRRRVMSPRQHFDWYLGDVSWLLARVEQAEAERDMLREIDALRVKETDKLVVAAEARVQALEQELKLGHARLDECADGKETVGLSLYERISKKIEKLTRRAEEIEHLVRATGAEKDAMKSERDAASHRQQIAEYRADRVAADVNAKLSAAEAALRAVREQTEKYRAEHFLAGCDGAVAITDSVSAETVDMRCPLCRETDEALRAALLSATEPSR